MTLREMLKNNPRYTWNRDTGDGPSQGKLDQMKVDKDEGYEVEAFIRQLMKDHGLTSEIAAKRIEKALHSCPSQYRDELIEQVEDKLNL